MYHNLPVKQLAACLLCLAFSAAFFPLSAACAQDAGKTVRVGWYESPFNEMDQSGRRSGYAYEYQRKIAAYTGWHYEYVTGSWPELMQLLMDGKLDLLSDVSFVEERTQYMLFSSLPMGTEDYYIFISPDNMEITPEDPSTLNGKKIGANKGSVPITFFESWAKEHKVTAELVELTCTQKESLRMLEQGELDAFITLDAYGGVDTAVPIHKVGSSDFYFAISIARPDLLEELNAAMRRIQDENRYYNQQLFEKYVRLTGANLFLSAEERAWLSGHGLIRVGYQDNYLAFCAVDENTGGLTGALKDYLVYASDCTANAHLEFEAVAYPTAAAAMDALKSGEVDCMFPANLGVYDGEMLGVTMTPSLMRTEIYAVIRQADQAVFSSREHVIVAVNEGNPNYDAFLLDHFPGWRKVYYPDTGVCLKAVADGVADCVLISNYRYNNIARLCDKYNLTTLPTGEGLDYSFAVAAGETNLYSILAKVAALVPASAVNAALSHYIAEDAKTTLTDFIMDNIGTVMAVTGAVVLVILALLARSIRSERKASRLISATETDELTGLYSRNFFFQYAERMYRDHPNTPMDAIVVNIEQFHSVNALNGREFGNQALRTLGNEIRDILNETGGIAGRFEADQFDIYCRHTVDYQAILDRLQAKLDALSPNASIRLRMGVMPWQAGSDPIQLFDQARVACAMARGHYKEHLIVFDEKVREREMYEQRLLNDLRRAVDEYQFEVHYQPKYDIQCDPPKLVSAEALIRWRHPELGMIAPDDFIPLFERNGRIGEVDKFVWSEAARQIARWRQQYGLLIPISVNLSRVDVFDPTLEKTLDDILQYNGLEHCALKLEVTESAYTENSDQVIRVVERLRQKGYEVEMDDFGSGYSSLNMLSAMPIDVLKMDRAFVQNIEHEEKDIQLVALILGIAKNLNVPVVAEGVETEEQMKLLKRLGCKLVQGYYFSRPLHPADFENIILRNKAS